MDADASAFNHLARLFVGDRRRWACHPYTREEKLTANILGKFVHYLLAYSEVWFLLILILMDVVCKGCVLCNQAYSRILHK